MPLERAPDEPGAAGLPWWERRLAPTFVATAGLAALLLGAALFFAQRAIGEASQLLVRGEAAQLAQFVHESLRGTPGPPDDDALARVLAAREEQGLRYVALLRPDARRVEAAAGTPASPVDAAALAALASRPGEPLFVGERVRVLAGPPGRPGPPGGAGLGRPGAPRLGPPDGGPPPGGGLRPPGRPLGRPPGGPPPLRLLLEFEPIAARQLLALSRRMLWVGVVAVPAFLASALFLGYLVRQRNRLLARLERGRRLAALGEMSAVMAHEIRNPLASLKGHAQLLARSLEDDPRRAKAELVVREAVRLQELATDLLDFSGSRPVERRDADPAALLRESAEAVEPGRIDLVTHEAPVTWRLDPARTRQALINLLRNAVQASPPDARVRAAAYRDGGRLVFEVRDHGAGIAPGDEERIFEPFYTRKLRGSGLGLAIARRIAVEQGGAIAAENAADGGAVFRFSLAGGS